MTLHNCGGMYTECTKNSIIQYYFDRKRKLK